MTSLAALAIALSALAADVTVKPLSGAPIEGRLTGLTTHEVTVETSSGQQKLAASDVMVIELPAEPSNGGDRPSQTARHAMSLTRITG